MFVFSDILFPIVHSCVHTVFLLSFMLRFLCSPGSLPTFLVLFWSLCSLCVLFLIHIFHLWLPITCVSLSAPPWFVIVHQSRRAPFFPLSDCHTGHGAFIYGPRSWFVLYLSGAFYLFVFSCFILWIIGHWAVFGFPF